MSAAWHRSPFLPGLEAPSSHPQLPPAAWPSSGRFSTRLQWEAEARSLALATTC